MYVLSMLLLTLAVTCRAAEDKAKSWDTWNKVGNVFEFMLRDVMMPRIVDRLQCRQPPPPDARPEIRDCRECIDCPIEPLVQQTLAHMTQLQQLDAKINSDLRFIRDKLVNADMTQISHLIGSTADGCSLAKWFHPDRRRHEIESDIQHYSGVFNESDKHLFEPVAAGGNKPDNVKIRLERDTLHRAAIDKLWKLLTQAETLHDDDALESRRKRFFDNEYVHPQVVREVAKTVLRFRDDNFEDTKLLASLILNIDIDLVQANAEETAPERGVALTTTLTVASAVEPMGMQLLKLSLDQVVAFKCNFWPDSAATFATRSSRYDVTSAPKWPTHDDRLALMQHGCDVVPKPSFGGDPNTEWRWSFTLLETKLMTSLSSDQLRSYLLAKIIFYSHVKPLNNDEVHSYWAKTTFFWMCEEHPSSDLIWCDENLLWSVQLFFEYMLEHIDRWRLPHFFVSEHSLLKGRPSTEQHVRELQRQLQQRLQLIIADVRRYTPTTADFKQALARLGRPTDVVDALASFARDSDVATFQQRIDEIRKIRDYHND